MREFDAFELLAWLEEEFQTDFADSDSEKNRIEISGYRR